MNFEKYLTEQVLRHPSVQPQDMIKMCYQAAYGAEHLLRDLKGAQRYLEEEYAAVEAKETELYESISSDVCRVNLAAWKYRGLPLSWLLRMFAASSGIRNQERDLFSAYLKTVGQAAEAGRLPFAPGAWQRCLAEYEQKPLSGRSYVSTGQAGKGTARTCKADGAEGDGQGSVGAGEEACERGQERGVAVESPGLGGAGTIVQETARGSGEVQIGDHGPVHHSAAYREAEKPAYRLVDKRYIRLLPVLEKAWEASEGRQPCIIAIDGRAASGKTTMAKQLREILEAPVVRMDDFFLPPDLRSPQRYEEPGGNVHYERFLEEVLPFLAVPECFSYRIFDCGKKDYSGECQVESGPFRIVEGSYSCHPRFGEYASVTVFLDVEPEEQMRRISLRNGEAMAELFRKKWIPLEEKYFAEYRIGEKADIRFD